MSYSTTEERLEMSIAETKPTVVFVHGSGETARRWQKQVAYLGSERALALDLPGHGTRVQEPGPPEMRMRDYALDVRQQMQAAGVHLPVVAGHSLGSGIALQLALEWGQELSGLILIGAGARLRVLPALLEAARRDQAAALQEIQGMGRHTPEAASTVGEGVSRADAAPDDEPAGLAPGMFYRDLAACDRFDVMAQLDQITLPVLVVCGEEDRMTPPKYAEYLRAHLPHATLRMIPGAGHDVMSDQPDALNATIDEWLKETFKG
jgi:pimeloyl-ACP methyl ester carboxylesterase